jgi:hypothetical protein
VDAGLENGPFKGQQWQCAEVRGNLLNGTLTAHGWRMCRSMDMATLVWHQY